VTELEVSPRGGQRHSRGWPDMPQMIILSLDWGLGEKGKTEKWASLSSRKVTFHFSTLMASRRSSTLMLRSGVWTGGPGTHQSIGGGTPPSIWRWGHLDLQWLSLQRGQGPSGGQGCLLGCSPFGHSLQKCPSCPQW
jgi:hypothetical protein